MNSGRILAVDYGSKNVGLACSDELRITVRPLESIPNRGRKDLVSRLLDAVARHQVSEIIVGMPLNMDGTRGQAVAGVERFMKTVRSEITLPVLGVDERLSTAEAEEIWREMGPRQQKKYRTIDSLAAALILKRYLQES